MTEYSITEETARIWQHNSTRMDALYGPLTPECTKLLDIAIHENRTVKARYWAYLRGEISRDEFFIHVASQLHQELAGLRGALAELLHDQMSTAVPEHEAPANDAE